MRPEIAAQALLLRQSQAVLASQCHEAEWEGFPLTSVVPYCLDAQGCPLLLISRLAAHTRNLAANRRLSLLVRDAGDDAQAVARLSLIGEGEPVPASELPAAAERYYRFFPQTRDFHQTLDFEFWRVRPLRSHFIAGFARVHWLQGADWLPSNPFAADIENDIIAHMNTDHSDALPLYAQQAGYPATTAEPVELVGIDGTGLHLRRAAQLLRVSFPHPVSTPGQVRHTLIELLRSARSETGASSP